ncbi:hypothetical protein O0L34_g3857 [Tuta absoluta]|nr:hypothetical protein O0L34_g3857 [Tuta absoluta]
MKPDEVDTNKEETESDLVEGDVIGDTAYSQRFVLKILLKLANQDTLKDEIQEKTFEDDLCTLWDMTSERDVVLFLLKHDVLNLFNFALPVIDTPRIIEIIIGMIGNMCCQKEAVAVLLKLDTFLTTLLNNINSDDSLILIQVFRLVSANLFGANDEALLIWMSLFKSANYSTALYFILKNSSNKDLLVTALDNLNTVTSYYNTEKFREDYFTHFVTLEALESLTAAFTELIITQNDICESEELERVLVISLQITLNLVSCDKSKELFHNSKENVIKVLSNVLEYYESKFVNQREIDSDLTDIVDTANSVVRMLNLSEVTKPDKYFSPSYRMWKALKLASKTDKNGCGFEDEDVDELQDFATKIKSPLSTLICSYLEKCQEEDFLVVLDKIAADYEEILNSVTDQVLKLNVSNRAGNYRTRLTDNVDS